jgi:hypothetical protein
MRPDTIKVRKTFVIQWDQTDLQNKLMQTISL